MKRWIGFLIIILSINLSLWACDSYQFHMKMFECDKAKIENENDIKDLIKPFTNSDGVTLDYCIHFNLFASLIHGGCLQLKTYPLSRFVKVKINTASKRSFATLIESFVEYFNPTFYTFNDSLFNTEHIFKD